MSSTDEYHCRQHDRMSTFKANVITYYAEERIQEFYTYLNTENVSLFPGVKVMEGVPTPNTELLKFVFIAVISIVIVTSIILIVLVVKKCRKPVK